MGRYTLILLVIWGSYAVLQVAEVAPRQFFWVILTVTLALSATVRLLRQPAAQPASAERRETPSIGG